MSGGRIRYGYGYPLKSAVDFVVVNDYVGDYTAYLLRADADSAESIPFVQCLFTRYAKILKPTINISKVFTDGLYVSYAYRSSKDSGAADTLQATLCAQSKFANIMPFATKGYQLTRNTQLRAAILGGNGYDPAALDCTYPKVDKLLNS
jgi:hypothetical protein